MNHNTFYSDNCLRHRTPTISHFHRAQQRHSGVVVRQNSRVCSISLLAFFRSTNMTIMVWFVVPFKPKMVRITNDNMGIHFGDGWWWDESEHMILIDINYPNYFCPGLVDIRGFDDFDPSNDTRFLAPIVKLTCRGWFLQRIRCRLTPIYSIHNIRTIGHNIRLTLRCWFNPLRINHLNL